MSQNDHEQELQDYLEGKSDLSQAYRAAPKPAPPARVDDAILAASRKAVKSRPRFAFSPFASDWHERAALAAVVVLSVVLIVTMQRQTRLTEPSGARPPPPAVLSDEAPGPVLKQKPAREQRADRIEGQQTQRKREAATLMKETAEPAGPVPAPPAAGKTSGTALKREMPESAKGEALSPMKAAPEQVTPPSVQSAPAIEEEMEPASKAVRRGLEKQQSFDAAAGSGKDAIERDRPLLNEEPAFMPAPAESPPAAADNEAKRQQPMGAVNGFLSPSLSAAEAWLDEIKTLWQAGQKEQARLELQAFLQSYPSYSEEQLREKLDPELVNAVLAGPE